MQFIFNDGGRKLAGRRGDAGDCLVRAIAIVTERPYQDVYDTVNSFSTEEKYRRGRIGFLAATGRGSSARTGVYKTTAKQIMAHFGLAWHPTMHFGKGCTVHMRPEELPIGRIIVNVSKHFAAVIDGVLHDTHDCSRKGKRCVYGYWTLTPSNGVT